MSDVEIEYQLEFNELIVARIQELQHIVTRQTEIIHTLVELLKEQRDTLKQYRDDWFESTMKIIFLLFAIPHAKEESTN